MIESLAESLLQVFVDHGPLSAGHFIEVPYDDTAGPK
jgi:hypothetical protein